MIALTPLGDPSAVACMNGVCALPPSAEEPVDIARSENIAATVEPTEPIADAAGTPPEQ